MNATMYAIITFSSLIAGIIGIIRFKKIDVTYFPFVFFIWIGIANDSLSYLRMISGHHSTVNNNIYVLFEPLILLWFFRTQQLLKDKKTLISLALVCVAVWTTETIIRSIFQIEVYFRIFYSFLMVLLSINLINRLLVTEKRSILRNASFLICIAFIIYFTMKALINAFWLYGLTRSITFLQKIQLIMLYLNLLTNLIYALAVLWIPKKQASILPS